MYNLDLKTLTFCIYRRKSTEDEDKQVASLPDQAIALDELVRRHHINPLQIISDIEEAHSAKNAGTRPGFKNMLDLIKNRQVNAVIVWHADRLSRNNGDVNMLIDLLESRQLIAIITPQYTFTQSPMDKFLLAFQCLQAKLENDNKGINVKRGLDGKVRKGWMPGVAKIGYLNNKAKERGERDILVDPERFDTVRKLLEYFLTGNYSVRQIHTIANEQLLLRTRKTKHQGGKPLSLSHTYNVLADPFYCGYFWWKNHETGVRELRKGNHTPMITEEEHRRIFMLLGHKPKPQPKTHLFAYTALVQCGECGAGITAEEKWQIICGHCRRKFASQNRNSCPACYTKIADMINKKILHYVYYHCTKRRNPLCSQRGVRVENFEAQIDEILMQFNIAEKYMRWAIETLKELSKKELATQQQIDSNMNRERTMLKDKLSELNRFIINQENAGWALMTKEEALAEKERLMAELQALERNQQTNNQRAGEWFESCVQVFDYACHARFWFREGTIEQKRAILEAIGSNLTLKDKKVALTLQYPLLEIQHMLEIAPEMISGFEPAKTLVNKRKSPLFQARIPSLLRGLNAVRTYFMNSGTRFTLPQAALSPSSSLPRHTIKNPFP